MFFGVGVSCRKLYSFVVYLYLNGSGSITSVGEEIELICLLLFTCNYVIFLWRGFLFLWVLGMGYVILLWHSLSLPYNYFEKHVAIELIIRKKFCQMMRATMTNRQVCFHID